MSELIISNVRVYEAIAEEAYTKMNEQLKMAHRPGADGEGWVVTPDWSQASFKNALVYITFSAIWLEATLHLLITSQYGKVVFRDVDKKPYEEKLALLGIEDAGLHQSMIKFRRLRRELIHEKAYFNQKTMRSAQGEAKWAHSVMQEVKKCLVDAKLIDN